MRIALIDLGTNSVRLFIFRINGNEAQKIFQSKAMVRLGDSLFETQAISGKAYKRTIRAFKQFRDIIEEYDVHRTVAVATSAMREATNAKRLQEAIFEKVGIQVAIISGEEEAQLIAEGVLTYAPILRERPDLDNFLLVDIGGGSTEISQIRSHKASYSTSLPLGAARCQQRFLKSVPPTKKGESALRSEIREILKKHEDHFRPVKSGVAIGSSGSIRALVRMCHGSGSKNKSIKRRQLRKMLNQLRPMSTKELRQIPTLEPKRIDLIFSAGVILDELMKYFDIDELCATSFALKDGILSRLCCDSFDFAPGTSP